MHPKYLYKYQSFPKDDLPLQNLQNHQIYFQYPNQFDDPYDCAIQIVKEISDDEGDRLWEAWKKGEIYQNIPFDEYSSRYQTNGRPNDKFRQAIFEPANTIYKKEREKILNIWGVSCFSIRNDNLLMWSHYGGGHRGFCLEFDTSYDPFNKALEVSYPDSEEVPSFSMADILQQKVRALTPMITTKARDWEYQKEWRIFNEYGGKTQQYDKKCLTRIFFGAKSLRKDHEKIIKALGNVPTQLYMMEPDSRSFRLLPTEYAQWLGKQSDFRSTKTIG